MDNTTRSYLFIHVAAPVLPVSGVSQTTTLRPTKDNHHLYDAFSTM